MVFSAIARRFVFSGGVAIAMSVSSAQADWDFEVVTDKFNDRQTVVASSDEPLEDIAISFECRNGRDFFFVLDTQQYLAKKKRSFKLHYRVDSQKSKTVKMRAFTNSSAGGLNDLNALEVANDIIGGRTIALRAVASSKDEYEATISLEQSIEAIVRTARACQIGLARPFDDAIPIR